MDDFCVFAIVGTVLTLVRFYYLASLWAKIQEIREGRATPQLLKTVYALIVFNCLLIVCMSFCYSIIMFTLPGVVFLKLPRLWYSLQELFRNDLLLSTMYESGVLIEDAYPLLFLLLAPYKEGMKIMKQYVVFRTVFVVFVACYSNFALGSKDIMLCCRVAVSALTIFTYSYRLIIIRLVIKTKSVQYIPFILSVIMFVSAAVWLVFCLIEMDLFVAIPYGFSTCLGAVQLILYAKYYDHARQLQPAD